jgi:hypothetical protein
MIALTSEERAKLIAAGVMKPPACTRVVEPSRFCAAIYCKRTPTAGRKTCDHHLAKQRAYDAAARLRKQEAKK